MESNAWPSIGKAYTSPMGKNLGEKREKDGKIYTWCKVAATVYLDINDVVAIDEAFAVTRAGGSIGATKINGVMPGKVFADATNVQYCWVQTSPGRIATLRVKSSDSGDKTNAILVADNSVTATARDIASAVAGAGNVDFSNVDGTVTANGTAGGFTSLKVGDLVDIDNGNAVGFVSKITNTNSMVIDFRNRVAAGAAAANLATKAWTVTQMGFGTLTGYAIGKGSIANTTARSLTGTANITASSNVVTGTGTLFLQELKIGDYVNINAELFTVTVLTNNTSCNVNTTAANTATVQTVTHTYKVVAGELVGA